MSESFSPAYQRIENLLAQASPVILDGGTATELERQHRPDFRVDDAALWGTWGLYRAPQDVAGIHGAYLAAGADVISTNTWGIVNAPRLEARRAVAAGSRPSHWLDVARHGVRLARQAVADAGREGEVAVAFSVNGDVENEEGQQTLALLTRIFADDPPDLILMETLSLIREKWTFAAVETMLATGLPVWLSFRRCRHGVCGVYGQHWGGPEGDLFGRAARRFERMGVGALLINCLPIDHVPGMLPWLRDFTNLPLGVYPNLGHYLDPGWQFDESVTPAEYAELALAWRREGAQIIGGCCGVTPEHIAAARAAVADTRPGRPQAAAKKAPPLALPDALLRDKASPQPWQDEQGRSLYPLAFPEIVVDPGVFRPTQGSFLLWKNLFTHGWGQGQRCLDIGCGSGILTVQLALNGAAQVEGLDVQQAAINNTMTNAFRNGVAEQVSARVVDLFTFRPDASFDLVVASLYQMPVDPMGEETGHRPVDFWGRNLLDHLIELLPGLLAKDGVAYLMQISILGQKRTAQLLEAAGLQGRVVDFAFFHFSSVFYDNIDQIHRVEELSDAYHLELGEDDVMVMYLIEVTHKE